MRGYPPPKVCPSREDDAQCQRIPTQARPPWHDGPHRAEVGEPIPRWRVVGTNGATEVHAPTAAAARHAAGAALAGDLTAVQVGADAQVRTWW